VLPGAHQPARGEPQPAIRRVSLTAHPPIWCNGARAASQAVFQRSIPFARSRKVSLLFDSAALIWIKTASPERSEDEARNPLSFPAPLRGKTEGQGLYRTNPFLSYLSSFLFSCL
jgi:hypothetical protein